MHKILHCNDVIPGCPFKAHGVTEDEVIAQAIAHVKSAHSVNETSPGLLAQIRGAIQDECVHRP